MSGRHLRTSLAAAVSGLLLLAGCSDSEPEPLSGVMGAAVSPSPTEPSQDPLAGAPLDGACYRMSFARTESRTNDSKPVDCYDDHTTMTYHVGRFSKDTVVSDYAKVQKKCQGKFREATGLDRGEQLSSVLRWAWFEPTTAQWAAGARWFRCDVIAVSQNRMKLLPSGGAPLFHDDLEDKYLRCIRRNGEEGVHVTCDKPHQYRWAGFFTVPDKKYPGRERVMALADEKCPSIVNTQSWWITWALESAWEAGERRVSCFTNTTS